MLAKNTRISAATVAVALITALLLALMATPAKPAKAAEPQSYLQLISLFGQETEDSAADDPYLRVWGNVVWSSINMDANDSANLQGLPEIPFPYNGSISVALF